MVCISRNALHNEEFSFLLRGIEASDVLYRSAALEGFTPEESVHLMHLNSLKAFKGIGSLVKANRDDVTKWKSAGGTVFLRFGTTACLMVTVESFLTLCRVFMPERLSFLFCFV